MKWLGFVLAALLVVTELHAEPPPPLIAVVDIETIVHNSNAGKSLDAQYEKQHQLFTDDVTKKERDLDSREQELDRQRTVLTPDSFNAEREALETYAANVQKGIQQQSQADQMAFNDGFAQLVKTIHEIVAQVAKEKGVTVVLPREQTLYLGDGTIDITSQVQARLEERLPSVPVVIPDADANPKAQPKPGSPK